MTARQTRFVAVTAGNAAPLELAPGCTTLEEQESMNARRFDALTVAVSPGARRASRRHVLRGLAALAAVGLVPGVVEAFDGGVAPVLPPASGLPCLSGADCAAGEICLNGACAPRQAVGTGDVTQQGTGTTPVQIPGTTPVAPPATETVPVEPTIPEGVGGLIQPGAPLPARIYSGRCGALGTEPAFQLIDVGPIEGAEGTPEGALTAIPAEDSTTVVNTTLETLLASVHAIDIRVDDADPATSIACGDIGGLVDAGADGAELSIGLEERGNSGYSGIAWLQEEGDRTVTRVFLARGLEGGGEATAAQVAPAETPAPVAETPVPAAPVEAPQAAGTPAPVADSLSPLGAGTRVVTTIDVNLRAEPSQDAPVITILGQGVELEVTGPPQDGWVPVVEPGSGQSGYVSDQFLTVVV
jgi:hypothetical protein